MFIQNSKSINLQLTTDYHCHILPDLDDGSATMQESVEMARALSAAGFTTVCCTPHLIKGFYESSTDEIRERTERLQQQLAMEAIQLQLIAGTEYYFDKHLPQYLHDPLPLPGGNILVEAPSQTTSAVIENLVDAIIALGFTPLIAHPERSPIFTNSREVKYRLFSFFAGKTKSSRMGSTDPYYFLHSLKNKGCRFQGNIGSFAGLYGEKVRNQAVALQGLGVYDCFGSDAHKSAQLAETLRQGMQNLNLTESNQPLSLQ